MNRTTIMLPRDLKQRAMRAAHAQGRSLGALIREAMTDKLKESEQSEQDPLFSSDLVFAGESPRDGAVSHNAYLYENKL